MMSIEAGKLYLYQQITRGHEYKYVLVFVVNAEKMKPIYTKFHILFLEENKSEKMIVDKFQLDGFESKFTEVTDEAQIENARKRVKK